MTLRYAEVTQDTKMDIQMALILANLTIAIGSIVSGLISWWRGGVVAVFIKNIGRIEDIEADVKEINEWKDNTDSLLVALALGNENVDDRKAMEKVGLKTEHKDLLDDRWENNDGTTADD